MDEQFIAYETGRADGIAAHRDEARAEHPTLGRDYRVGFLDGRIEVFRLMADLRKIVEDPD